MIDALASQPHYVSHLASIWLALDPTERGTFFAVGAAADTIAAEGLPNVRFGYPPPGNTPTLIAGFVDEQLCRRPCIYLEHGAGQTYQMPEGYVPDPSYHGSPLHDRVILFLAPRQSVADAWLDRYPNAAAVAVGVPRLDHLHRRMARPRNDPPVVAVTFHHDARLVPETVGAWSHYDAALPALAAAFANMLGHGHPRLWSRLRLRWEALGVEPVADLNEVLARADLLVLDNTSAGPEAASVGIPLLWLSAPWWRRDVTHGGRFWEWPEGQVQCDDPGRLVEQVIRALEDPQPVREAREAMVRSVYLACDGKATERAVAAIRDVVFAGV